MTIKAERNKLFEAFEFKGKITLARKEIARKKEMMIKKFLS